MGCLVKTPVKILLAFTALLLLVSCSRHYGKDAFKSEATGWVEHGQHGCEIYFAKVDFWDVEDTRPLIAAAGNSEGTVPLQATGIPPQKWVLVPRIRFLEGYILLYINSPNDEYCAIPVCYPGGRGDYPCLAPIYTRLRSVFGPVVFKWMSEEEQERYHWSRMIVLEDYKVMLLYVNPANIY